MALLIPLAVLALMWAFLILPQQKRVRAHRAFVTSLSVGDDVITTSGLYGTVVGLDTETAQLAIAPGVEITVARMAIGQAQVTREPAGPEHEPPEHPDDPTE